MRGTHRHQHDTPAPARAGILTTGVGVGKKLQRDAERTVLTANFTRPQIKILDTPMPRSRTPSKVLELNGAFRHDPARRRIDPTPHGPIGKAPKQGPITFKKAWDLIVAQCPAGVLADRDRVWVELAASLFVQFRNDPAGMHPAKLSRLTAMLASLGMSPADASRVRADPVKPRNDFVDE